MPSKGTYNRLHRQHKQLLRRLDRLSKAVRDLELDAADNHYSPRGANPLQKLRDRLHGGQRKPGGFAQMLRDRMNGRSRMRNMERRPDYYRRGW